MTKSQLSSFDNRWYSSGAGRVKMVLWFLTNAILFRTSWNALSVVKRFLLICFGAKLGKGLVKTSINIKYPWLLEVGDHSWIGENVWIDNLTQVTIGDNVCISQGAMLLTGNHNYKQSSFDLMVGEIIIEEGAWIGAKSIVCPGVKVGSHAVLAVGSVATSNLEPYTIYQGNPAVAVRKRLISDGD